MNMYIWVNSVKTPCRGQRVLVQCVVGRCNTALHCTCKMNYTSLHCKLDFFHWTSLHCTVTVSYTVLHCTARRTVVHSLKCIRRNCIVLTLVHFIYNPGIMSTCFLLYGKIWENIHPSVKTLDKTMKNCTLIWLLILYTKHCITLKNVGNSKTWHTVIHFLWIINKTDVK